MVERIFKRESVGLKSFQPLIGLLGIALLSEVIVKIPKRLIHSEPAFLEVEPGTEEIILDFDKSTNQLTVQTDTHIGLQIGTLNFAIQDSTNGKKPRAKIRINCDFYKTENGSIFPKGGFATWISNSTLRVAGIDFTHTE